MPRVRAQRPFFGLPSAWGLCVLTSACGPERPPTPDDVESAGAAGDVAQREAQPKAAGVARVTPADLEAGAVLTFAGDRGAFFDVQSLEDVPEGARGFVRVVLASGPKPPPGKVWVVNFDSPPGDAGGEGWPLQPVARDMYEEYALGQGNTSQAALPDGLEAPEVAPKAEKLVVYKTSWCGVCKKLQAYLDRKGVDYELKDVEKDPGAAAELKAKAAKRGGWSGSVPVIDLGDELMVGFDRAKLEQLL